MELIAQLALQLAQMVLVLALTPLLTGFVRKLKARLQRRAGPPLLQVYRDLAKLIAKDAIVATDASWLFRVFPYLIFAATWVAASLVPSFGTNLLFSWSGDLIVIVALLGSARFVQMLAALDVGTAFGGLGASREAMIASLAEPAMLMMVFTVALVAGTSQLSAIAEFMHSGEAGLRLSLALALVALVIVALAETGRFPVDNPANSSRIDDGARGDGARIFRPSPRPGRTCQRPTAVALHLTDCLHFHTIRNRANGCGGRRAHDRCHRLHR